MPAKVKTTPKRDESADQERKSLVKQGVKESGGPKKRRRTRPHIIAAREVKKYQDTTARLLPRVHIKRIFRSILAEMGVSYDIREGAIDALQAGVEQWMSEKFKEADDLRELAKGNILSIRFFRAAFHNGDNAEGAVYTHLKAKQSIEDAEKAEKAAAIQAELDKEKADRKAAREAKKAAESGQEEAAKSGQEKAAEPEESENLVEYSSDESD
jgi:histone H3/H4